MTPIDLEQFARKLFEAADWPEGGDIEGGEFQDIAVACGLLIPETRTTPCAEQCWCEEYYGDMREGVTCYRKAPFLLSKEPTLGQP